MICRTTEPLVVYALLGRVWTVHGRDSATHRFLQDFGVQQFALERIQGGVVRVAQAARVNRALPDFHRRLEAFEVVIVATGAEATVFSGVSAAEAVTSTIRSTRVNGRPLISTAALAV